MRDPCAHHVQPPHEVFNVEDTTAECMFDDALKKRGGEQVGALPIGWRKQPPTVDEVRMYGWWWMRQRGEDGYTAPSVAEIGWDEEGLFFAAPGCPRMTEDEYGVGVEWAPCLPPALPRRRRMEQHSSSARASTSWPSEMNACTTVSARSRAAAAGGGVSTDLYSKLEALYVLLPRQDEAELSDAEHVARCLLNAAMLELKSDGTPPKFSCLPNAEAMFRAAFAAMLSIANEHNLCLDCGAALVACDCRPGCPGGTCAVRCEEKGVSKQPITPGGG